MKIRITGLQKFQSIGQNNNQLNLTPITGTGTYNWMAPMADQNPLALKKTVVKADGTSVTTGNVGEGYTVYEQAQQYPGTIPQVDITTKKQPTFREKVGNFVNQTENRLMDQYTNPRSGLNRLGVIDSFAQMIGKRGQEQEEGMRMMDRNAGYNRMGDTNVDRGDYGVGPTDFGLFRPNQMGVNSPQGQYNGGRFFQEGGDFVQPREFENISIDALVGNPLVNPMDYMPQTGPQYAPPRPVQPMDVNIPEPESLLKDVIAARESGGDYQALPKKKDGTLASSAAGKYQFLWDVHGKAIKEVTGVKTKQEFLNSPEAQEAYFDYWNQNTLTPTAERIKQQFKPKEDINQLKMMVHFSGAQGAIDYYSKGKVTKDAFGTTNASYLNKGLVKGKGVNINNLDPGLSSFASTMSSYFPGIAITSGNDKTHMKGSKHYKDKAIDIGANSSDKVAYSNLRKFLTKDPSIRQRYGIEDIIDEGDHLHIEMMRSGGEYELTADQIMQIRAMGGDVEFI